MAPIPKIITNPISIISGALFSTLSSPESTAPTNGTNATIWGSEYKGSASFFNITLVALPQAANVTVPLNVTAPVNVTDSVLPSNSSLVYFTSEYDTFLGCDNKTFTSSDNVALMNPLQFGDVTSSNTTCGQWISVQNRENTYQKSLVKVVGVCDECEYGSISLTIPSLDDLAPSLPFYEMVFDAESELTVGNLTDPANPLPVESTPISPYDLVHIAWSLSDPPAPEPKPTTPATPTPTKAKSTTTTTTTTTTKTKTKTKTKTTTSPKPTKTKKPSPPPKPTANPGGKKYSGRGTWFSDTSGQCEHSFSQSDMIVAVNEAQMGNGKSLCGKKLVVTAKGSSASVVVTVVDMCPSEYCDFGALDLSQGAFKKLADLDKGVLELSWSFL
ncbi:hypothetical protein BG004_006358 [Podila humilis]|nr:hypothetical protein BG004_006358 [Podila humilis]